MTSRLTKCVVLLLVTFCTLSLWAGDSIPKIAWKRGIGEPLANAGTRKPEINNMIDDGYWQGAPKWSHPSFVRFHPTVLQFYVR